MNLNFIIPSENIFPESWQPFLPLPEDLALLSSGLYSSSSENRYHFYVCSSVHTVFFLWMLLQFWFYTWFSDVAAEWLSVVFFMFIQVGVGFVSWICRFIFCIKYLNIGWNFFIFFSVSSNIRSLDFVPQVHKCCNINPLWFCFSSSLCFMTRIVRNVVITSGEVAKLLWTVELWERVA